MNFAKLVNLAMDCEVGKVVCEVGNGFAKLAKWFAKLAMGCEFGNGFAKLAKWFANLAKLFAKLAMRNFAKVQFAKVQCNGASEFRNVANWLRNSQGLRTDCQHIAKFAMVAN